MASASRQRFPSALRLLVALGEGRATGAHRDDGVADRHVEAQAARHVVASARCDGDAACRIADHLVGAGTRGSSRS